MDTQPPKAIGSPESAFSSTMNILKNINAKSVLDCPAGHGAFSKQLIEGGFDLTCCDIDPESFNLSDVKCDFADLNKELPYNDNSFDAVVCLNGLHRVWARGRAMREFSRVLKPGGHLIVTFCNPSSITHRLTYLLSGTDLFDTVGPPLTQDPEAENPEATFRYAMSIAHFASSVKSVGMEISSIGSCQLSLSSVCLFPLAIFPLLFHPIAPKRFKETCFTKETSNLSSLFADFLIVSARK